MNDDIELKLSSTLIEAMIARVGRIEMAKAHEPANELIAIVRAARDRLTAQRQEPFDDVVQLNDVLFTLVASTLGWDRDDPNESIWLLGHLGDELFGRYLRLYDAVHGTDIAYMLED
jgi:hypothetical protein